MEPIFSVLGDREEVDLMEKEDILLFLMNFMNIGFTNKTIISKFVEKITTLLPNLTEYDIN